MRGKSSQISHSIQKKRENTAKSGSCGITDYGRKEGDVELRTNQQPAARLIAEEREVRTGDLF